MAKMNISTASPSKKAAFYVPTKHLTTLSLTDFRPTNIIPVRAGDRVHVNYFQKSYTKSLAVPTFGSFKIKTFAYFCPWRVIWRGYEGFISNTVDTTVPKTPISFELRDLMEILLGAYVEGNSDYVGEYEIKEGTMPSTVFDQLSPNEVYPNTHDFEVMYNFERSGSNTIIEIRCFNLNARGRRLFNILESLGYQLPTRYSLYVLPWEATSSAQIGNEWANDPNWFLLKLKDALPLFAFGRFIYDYVYPSQYVQQQQFGMLFETDSFEVTQAEQWLTKLLDLVFVPYEQDFFTSLWLKPNSVGTGTGASIQSMANIANGAGSNVLSLLSSEDYTTIRQSSSGQTPTITSYSLRLLESISDFCLRNNIGGTRFHEFLKSHFGFVTTDQDHNRCTYLKSWVDTVNFTPVTSTGEGDNILLGERAAKGDSSGNGSLRFEASEDGFLMFVTMVVPVTAYYQGEKPWCEALTSRFQLYTPELDSVGLEPVPRSAVYASFDAPDASKKVNPASLNDMFGNCPRYARYYKVGHDYLTGDFRLGSRNNNLEAYHTFRDVLYGRDNLALDAQFLSADNQYDRVYAQHGESAEIGSFEDKIETLFLFDVTKFSNMLSIGDSMPIFNKSGRDVTVDYQGTQIS